MFNQWYEIIGYLYSKALRHLKSQCQEVVFLLDTLLELKYKEYYLNNAKRVLYRYSMLRYLILFQRLYQDLILIPNSLGGENYILYFIYLTSYIYFIYYLLGTSKAYILPYFKYITKYIKQYYSLKVYILYRDGEITIRIGNSFTSQIS